MRITGTEMEWGGMIAAEDSTSLEQVNVGTLHPYIDKYLEANGITRIGSISHSFLANGARFYDDVSQRREYATPEDDSFMGTAANEMAGDHIMAGIADMYTASRGRRLLFTKRVSTTMLLAVAIT